MDKYTVKVTEHAEEAMRSIGMYIAFKLINPKAAFDLLDLFQKEIESLETMPERVALAHEEPWRSYGVRQLIVKNYYIYFWINEDEKKVQVMDVIYAKRDQSKALYNIPMD